MKSNIRFRRNSSLQAVGVITGCVRPDLFSPLFSTTIFLSPSSLSLDETQIQRGHQVSRLFSPLPTLRYVPSFLSREDLSLLPWSARIELCMRVSILHAITALKSARTSVRPHAHHSDRGGRCCETVNCCCSRFDTIFGA